MKVDTISLIDLRNNGDVLKQYGFKTERSRSLLQLAPLLLFLKLTSLAL